MQEASRDTESSNLPAKSLQLSIWLSIPLFVLAWVSLFQISRAYLIIPGITFCFLPAGATFFFTFHFGNRALPLSLLGPVINSLLFIESSSATVLRDNFLLDIRHVVCIGGCGLLYRRFQKGKAPLQSLSDALTFTGIACLSGLSSGLWAQLILQNSAHWMDWVSTWAGFAIGDTNGILLIVPALFLLCEWPKLRDTEIKMTIYLGGLTVVCTWLAFGVPHLLRNISGMWYPIFIPVLVSGLKYGTKGTTLTLSLVSVGTVILINEFGMSRSLLDLQIFMLTLSVVGYLFAGAGSEHREALILLMQNDLVLQKKVESRTSELSKTVKNLEVSESKYRDLFENSTNLVQGVDPEGNVVFANKAWKDALGFDLGTNMRDFIHPEHAELCNDIFRKLLNGENQPHVETVFVTKHGKEIMVEGNLSCRFINGRPHMTRGIFTDVSERKKMESILRMNQEITTSSIHNIGNVLSSVNTSTQLMLEKLNASKVESLVKAAKLLQVNGDRLLDYLSKDARGSRLPEFMIKAIERVDQERQFLIDENERLIAKVDLIHKISRPQQRLSKSNALQSMVSLSQVIDDSLNIQIPPGALIEIQKEYRFSGNPLLPLVESTHIFMNLFKNAKEALACSRKKVILITAWQDGSKLRMNISDSGMGIPQENLSSMFNHGFTTKDAGHGFGLSYCARIVKEIGGDMSVSSDGPDKGATFSLSFPFITSENQA